MKIILKYFYLLSILFIYCPNSYSQSAYGGLSAEQIYKKVTNAVVVVHAYDYNDKLTAQGSGVVLNDKGYIVTNYHILPGNERLEILHGKEIVPYVDIIGIDVEKDILILKIESKKFPAVKIGNSKSLKIGQRVYAIGSPMGFENTISEGIISGLRSYDELKRDFIQITASISSGSSGGAVVNDKGELIGISTLTIKEGQNINFAVPIDDVLAVEIRSYTKNDEYKDFELFYKGYDAVERGNYYEAIKYFSRFIEKYPNYAEAYYNRGIAKNYLQNNLGAIQDFNKAIELNPNLELAYYNRGTVKYQLKDYIDAIQDYSKVIELDPNTAVAYFSRGTAKSKLEDYKGAIQDFNKAIELDPNYAEAYHNREFAKGKLQDYKGAIQDYSKEFELEPNEAAVYMNIGISKHYLRDYRGAIQEYNKAIELEPNYTEAYYNRGISKFEQEDYVGSIKDFNKAIELEPNYTEAYYNRGILKSEQEDYVGSIKDFNKAIELNPNLELAYYNRGTAKMKLEDCIGAIQDFNKVIELDPNTAMAYINRGIAKAILGDKTGACLDWSKAGELGYLKGYELIKKFCK